LNAKIPSIRNAFGIDKFKLTPNKADQIEIKFENISYKLDEIPKSLILNLEPHFGWKNHIEFSDEL